MTSSTDRLLLVGGYATADQPGIQAFTFNESNGALTLAGSFAGVVNPSFLVVHPNGRWLYAVSETNQGAVWALRFEHEPWSAEALNHQPSGGDAPCHLLIDASEKWLFVSNYSSGSIAVLPIREDGSLGEATECAQHHGSGPNPTRQEGPHAHSTMLTPDNRFAIVADLGIDQLVVYAFDSSAGTLTPHAQVATHPGAGPRHMTFHPDGEILYVANELDSTVSVYDYDAASGGLSNERMITTLPPDAPENTVADIHIDASAEHLYVSNRGHNSIAVFNVDAQGLLIREAVVPCGGICPRNFALTPDGGFVLVANQQSDEVTVLPLISGSAAIGAPIANAAASQPSCIQFVMTQ